MSQENDPSLGSNTPLAVRLNQDLVEPRWMYLKGALLALIGLVSAGLILLETPSLKIAFLLVLSIWGFCRAYYFAFYVIQHYIDPNYRFAGLFAFLKYIFFRKSEQKTKKST